MKNKLIKIPVAIATGALTIVSGLFAILGLILASYMVWPPVWIIAGVLKFINHISMQEISWWIVAPLGPAILLFGLSVGFVSGIISSLSAILTRSIWEN